MSYKNRKLINEGFHNPDPYSREGSRVLQREGFLKVFQGIFDSMFKNHQNTAKLTEDEIKELKENGVNIDTRDKAKLIKLLNTTFANKEWLADQELITGDIKVANLEWLLIDTKYSGSFVDAVVKSQADYLAIVENYSKHLSDQSSVIEHEWGKVLTKMNGMSSEELEEGESKIEKLFADAKKAVDAKEPLDFFKKPKKVLGGATIQHGKKGLEELSSKDSISSITALSAEELQRLAEFLIDELDVILAWEELIYDSMGGIDYDTLGDCDLWWDSYGDGDFIMEIYFQARWEKYLPAHLTSYDGDYKKPFNEEFPNKVIELLLAHIE